MVSSVVWAAYQSTGLTWDVLPSSAGRPDCFACLIAMWGVLSGEGVCLETVRLERLAPGSTTPTAAGVAMAPTDARPADATTCGAVGASMAATRAASDSTAARRVSSPVARVAASAATSAFVASPDRSGSVT